MIETIISRVSWCLVIGALTLFSACISTGTKAINDPALMAKIEIGKSTKAEVTDLLGFPEAAAYPRSQEVWQYSYQTIDPKPYNYLPIIKIVNGFDQETRLLTITFNQEGIVQKIERQQISSLANGSGLSQ
jgi:outer membrane protein assembly factor BamE (lipoprotein component of BamABCDE complex)